jgi:hypothetical protein
VPAGEAIFTVSTEGLNPANAKNATTYGGEGGKASEQMNKGRRPSTAVDQSKDYVKIPLKYADPKTSGLKQTLVAGKQSFDLELKD